MITYKRLTILSLILSISLSVCLAQDPDSGSFPVDVSGKEINWDQFPDFKLPFTIVYHGNLPKNGTAYPLLKGFSHIHGNVKSLAEPVPYQNRVYLWTGIVGADRWAKSKKQPWIMIKSPWGNDIDGYRKKWWSRLSYIKRNWDQEGNLEVRDFDIIIADIERARHSDKDILAIKDHFLVPEKYRVLPNEDFVRAYKKAMQELYNEPLKLIRDSLSNEIKISSYSDTPVRRNWWGIGREDVISGLKDGSAVDFLVRDDIGKVNSDFYNNLDFISPSAYFFYDPTDKNFGKNYLAYLLYQIDANKIWSDKPQLIFVWMNYHTSASPDMEPILPEMAEASAIFPLISGVGIYNWRMSTNEKGNYEYFIRGLYRMSKFSQFFDGEEEYIKTESAYRLFKDKMPVWRAVVNDDGILVAAHNPYAMDDEITEMVVEYRDWTKIIELFGREVFLQAFDMD